MANLKNGKTLAEAISEFREYKAPSESKMGKYDYYKIEEYIELLDRCFGVDGYEVSYSEASTVTVSPTQVVLLIKATVQVFDETGAPTFKFEGYGTHEPTRESERGADGKPTGMPSDRAINLETLGQFGCVNALKSACTQLGSFGMRDPENDRKRPNAPGRVNTPPARSTRKAAGNAAPAAPMQGAEEEVVSFFVTERAKDGGTDQNGNPVYILQAHEVVGSQAQEKPSEVIFYNNFYKDCATRVARLTTGWNGMPVRLKIRVKRIPKDKQKNVNAFAAYTFRGYANE